jgi:hypothetical protein
MSTTYLRNKLHVPSAHGSLSLLRWKLNTDLMQPPISWSAYYKYLQKSWIPLEHLYTHMFTILNVAEIFLTSITKYVHNPKPSGTNIPPTSQVQVSAMLSLLGVGKWEMKGWSGLQWNNFYTIFREHQWGGSKTKIGSGQTQAPRTYSIILL